MFLYTFLVISFARYKEPMICLISFNKFPDVLPAFSCYRTYFLHIGNLLSICLGVKILRPSPYFVLYLASDAIE